MHGFEIQSSQLWKQNYVKGEVKHGQASAEAQTIATGSAGIEKVLQADHVMHNFQDSHVSATSDADPVAKTYNYVQL